MFLASIVVGKKKNKNKDKPKEYRAHFFFYFFYLGGGGGLSGMKIRNRTKMIYGEFLAWEGYYFI